eukprot:929356-Prymnesium_polylepis.2
MTGLDALEIGAAVALFAAAVDEEKDGGTVSAGVSAVGVGGVASSWDECNPATRKACCFCIRCCRAASTSSTAVRAQGRVPDPPGPPPLLPFDALTGAPWLACGSADGAAGGCMVGGTARAVHTISPLESRRPSS